MDSRQYWGEQDVKRMVASYLDDCPASEQPTQIVVVPASSFVPSSMSLVQTILCGVLLYLSVSLFMLYLWFTRLNGLSLGF